ncbi:PEP-CTERM sorting domain-containing protein [Myxococcus sp. CA033]|uniref:PEP-CTERM sorting domain-containing protein n=1 Tax=Myxococcus sp. CA033 TaxID=2741516 RepID=UPI00157B11D0|nr:PEP-CTERM sorting domain-containing protein [Myxococcus sp. CA033]NTX33811.1 PEP-CTERM sorting domain-containing protein [Myxococcus sp. CA033]
MPTHTPDTVSSPGRRLARQALLLTTLSTCLLGLFPAHAEDGAPARRDTLLVGNTRGNNVVRYDARTGEFLGDFIPSGSGGLVNPDSLVFGPDGHLYVASGDTLANSAILRFNGRTGAFIDTFASGAGLFRPYGQAFGPDGLLYVSSFLTDKILRFNARTGAFVDVFASGNGLPGGLNGPNFLAFGPDHRLYVTTQGSVAVDGVPTFPGLPSQVLRFDLWSRRSEVFIDQPAPSPDGAGFISLLGLAFSPGCSRLFGDCDLLVSDFANDIHRYDFWSRRMESTLSTNYTGTVPTKNFRGGVVFGTHERIYTVGFDFTDPALSGAVLRFDGRDDSPLPSPGNGGALLVPPSTDLLRPVGIAFVPGR